MRLALVCDPETTEVARAVDAGLFLSAVGDSVAIVTSSLLDSKLAQTITASGLGLVTVGGRQPEILYAPRDELLRFSEEAAAVCRSFDIAYFLSGGGSAVHTLRERRLTGSAGPVCVVVLDGTLRDRLLHTHRFPNTVEYLSALAHERYSVRHADWILASDAELIARLPEGRGTFPKPCLIRSGEEWVAAHKKVRETQRATPPRKERSSTILVLYRDHAELLVPLLRALESQQDPVIVIDLGGTAGDQTGAFSQARLAYEPRGWGFIGRPTRLPGAAVNEAVRRTATDDLIFLDTGYQDPAWVVQKLKTAMEVSGDDCISAPTYCVLAGGTVRVSVFPGHPLEAGLTDRCQGRPACIIRREVFHAAGGFLEDGGVDWTFDELLARLSYQGRSIDVLPDRFLYAAPPEPLDEIDRQEQILDLYEGSFAKFALPGLPRAVLSLTAQRVALEHRAETVSRRIDEMEWRWGGRQGELRVLILAPYLPYPPTFGGSIRVWEMAKYFGRRHDVTMVSFLDQSQKTLLKKEIKRHIRTCYGVEYWGEPPPEARSLPALVQDRCRPGMLQALDAIPTERFDVAIIGTILMASYQNRIDTKSVLVEQNVESELLRRASALSGYGNGGRDFQNATAQAELLRRYEEQVWPLFGLRAVASNVDRGEMDRRCLSGRTIVVENGTDPALAIRSLRPDRNTILFAGALGYYPNIDGALFFFHEIWPYIRRLNPSARLVIAGRYPTPEVRALDGKDGVRILANPGSMAKVASQASIAIAPLRIGSGTRIKILDAFAFGLPVVSTSLGGEGLEVLDHQHLLIRDDPHEFAEACQDLLQNRELWKRLHENGRHLVEHRYSWAKIFEGFERAIREYLVRQ